MILSVDAACDVGCVRTNNEDMLLIGDLFLRNDCLERKIINVPSDADLLIAVSDGMGGHLAGEVASEVVLSDMNKALKQIPKGLTYTEVAGRIEEIVGKIHMRLNRYGEEHPESRGLGCTFTAVFFYESKIIKIHIGDSRLYRFRGKYLTPLTEDHTLSNLLKDPSIPSNKLSNSFGGGVSKIFIDFEDLTERVIKDDCLLLCSDGLSGEITNDHIELCLQNDFDALQLVNESKIHGGYDNISCILLRI